MKTVSRMIFRYLLAAFGIAFLVLTVNGALLIGVVLHYGAKGQQEGFFPVGKFAESFTRDGRRLCPRPGHGMAGSILRGRCCWGTTAKSCGRKICRRN